MAAGEEKVDLKRVIGFWGGTALIIGITIGSGIFRKPYTLAKDLHDPVAILGLWTVFGVISLCGALALAELSSMLPRTGGAYVFLRAAYGDSAAFVFGWLYLLVTAPAGIGALAAFFAELLLGVFGVDPATVGRWTIPAIGCTTVVLLSLANLFGAKLGSAIQGVFTPNESTTFGMLQALKKSGVNKKVKLIGFDSSDKLVAALKDGDIEGLVVQNPFNMGYLAVKTMMTHLKGGKIAPRIDTGSTLVTKDNMNDPKVSRLLKPDLKEWLGGGN